MSYKNLILTSALILLPSILLTSCMVCVPCRIVPGLVTYEIQPVYDESSQDKDRGKDQHVITIFYGKNPTETSSYHPTGDRVAEREIKKIMEERRYESYEIVETKWDQEPAAVCRYKVKFY